MKLEALNSFSTRDQMKALLSLCGFLVDRKWNLIYKATKI
jgi:hypothetical protein